MLKAVLAPESSSSTRMVSAAGAPWPSCSAVTPSVFHPAS